MSLQLASVRRSRKSLRISSAAAAVLFAAAAAAFFVDICHSVGQKGLKQLDYLDYNCILFALDLVRIGSVSVCAEVCLFGILFRGHDSS